MRKLTVAILFLALLISSIIGTSCSPKSETTGGGLKTDPSSLKVASTDSRGAPVLTIPDKRPVVLMFSGDY